MVAEIRQDVLSDESISVKDKQVMLKDETIKALDLINDYDDEENIIYGEDDKISHWLKTEEVVF